MRTRGWVDLWWGARAGERRPPGGVGPPLRKILHLDMDAFYASVEQRDRPELRGRPVAVGGARGARRGVRGELRGPTLRRPLRDERQQGGRLCSHLTFVPRFPVYRDVVPGLRHPAVGDPPVELLSIDEAFLDVTENRPASPARRVAQHLRARIEAELSLTASVGSPTSSSWRRSPARHRSRTA